LDKSQKEEEVPRKKHHDVKNAADKLERKPGQGTSTAYKKKRTWQKRRAGGEPIETEREKSLSRLCQKKPRKVFRLVSGREGGESKSGKTRSGCQSSSSRGGDRPISGAHSEGTIGPTEELSPRIRKVQNRTLLAVGSKNSRNRSNVRYVGRAATGLGGIQRPKRITPRWGKAQKGDHHDSRRIII